VGKLRQSAVDQPADAGASADSSKKYKNKKKHLIQYSQGRQPWSRLPAGTGVLVVKLFFFIFFYSATLLERGPAGSQLGSFEDPVSLLKSSYFGVWSNCSCVVFFCFFFWHM
jgi:hypothetical protein